MAQRKCSVNAGFLSIEFQRKLMSFSLWSAWTFCLISFYECVPSCELFFRITSRFNLVFHFQDLRLGKGRTRKSISFSRSLIIKDCQMTAKHTGPALSLVTMNQSLPLLTQPALHTKSFRCEDRKWVGRPVQPLSHRRLRIYSMSFFSSLYLVTGSD